MKKDIMFLIQKIAENPNLSGLWLSGWIGVKRKLLEKIFEDPDVNEVTIGHLRFHRLEDGIYLEARTPEAYRVMMDTSRDV